MVVVASVREGRVGESVAEWFVAALKEAGGFEVDLVDLAALDLPMMTEPNHPRLRKYTLASTRAWSERVEGSDAFVFVTPEYNFSYSAPLKNAIDYLHSEWSEKPLGFVTYGGVSGGTRAMVALLPAVYAVGLRPVHPPVNIPFVGQFITDEGAFEPNEPTLHAATQLFEELKFAAQQLSQYRAARRARQSS